LRENRFSKTCVYSSAAWFSPATASAAAKGVHWERDTEMGGEGASNQYFLGKKNGVVVLHAKYYAGHRGESLNLKALFEVEQPVQGVAAAVKRRILPQIRNCGSPRVQSEPSP
jgi:hypothetical protein